MSEKKDIEKFNEHTPGKVEARDTSLVTDIYCIAVVEKFGEYQAPEYKQNLDFLAHCWNTYYEKEASLRSTKELVDELVTRLESMNIILRAQFPEGYNGTIEGNNSLITKAKAATSKN